jgi:hypothetical protein
MAHLILVSGAELKSVGDHEDKTSTLEFKKNDNVVCAYQNFYTQQMCI